MNQTRHDLDPHRDDVLVRMQQVLGDRPDPSRRVPPDVQVVEETHGRGLRRRKVTFAVEPGDRCCAWLFIPEACAAPQAAPRPAMVCLHQTIRIGKCEPAGLGGNPNLHYALELAQRGYVALAPDYPNFGEYRVDCYALGYASATMKGIWNHMRAVDLLAGMPEVDAARIGCIGHSLGAHNALWLAAYDPRIRVTVSSCGFTRFTWNDNEGRGRRGDLTDWSHKGYMPRIAERYACKAENMPFDFEDVLGVVAPRALFVNAPMQDFFHWEGVRECAALVEPIYARHGVPGDFVCHHPECAHDFPEATREQAYRFVDRVLSD